MGRCLQVEWHESENELKRRYQRSGYWQGKRMADGVAVIGVNYRTLQEWVAWYLSRNPARN